MTNQGIQFPKFYVTAPSACPYLEGKVERKVFTELAGPDAASLNEALGRVGFRRSQSVAYRPACENCTACVSVRIKAQEFQPSRSQKRILKANNDICAITRTAQVSEEQYELLRLYLVERHGDGSMAEMKLEEYKDMVETSPVETSLVEYRRTITGDLIAAALTDNLSDGLSMVYSFFRPDMESRSLGSYVILEHVKRVQAQNSDFVYLGYWVEGSPKMDYKRRFRPLERLGPEGWHDFEGSVSSNC